jgi:integrase
MLSPELAIGIRRVKGVKRLGTRIGNWLSTDQAQDLLDSIPRSTILGRRDAALVGLLLRCGLRRSEAVSLRLDQIQLREGHWVVADLYGKGGRLRTVPVPGWCKALIDRWLRASGVSEGLVFRRIWKNRTELSRGIAPDVVWTAVKRYAKRIGVDHLAPHDLRRTCARLCHGAGRRTRTDSIPARSRLSPNDGTVHRVQTEVQRCGQRSVPNIPEQVGRDNPVYYFAASDAPKVHLLPWPSRAASQLPACLNGASPIAISPLRTASMR